MTMSSYLMLISHTNNDFSIGDHFTSIHRDSIEAGIESLESREQIASGNLYSDKIRNHEQLITQLRLSFDELICAHNTLESPSANGVHNATSNRYIRHFAYPPFDILSAIFMQAPMPSDLRTQFAIAVSQVSRHWRQVA
jgi:hypothetical protein